MIRFASSRAALLLAPAALALPATAQNVFDAPEYVIGSTGGEFRGSGDFDGDGDQDLVRFTGWLNWTGVTVYFNDGAGGFTPGPEYAFVVAPGVDVADNEPVAVGDFNGDGLADVAFEHDTFVGSQSGLEILLSDGVGGFTSYFSPLDRGSWFHAPGNIDADAADELFVYVSDNNFDRFVHWVDWNGSGFDFSPPLEVGGGPDPESGVFVFTIGDFDSDGDDDVAATTTDMTKVRLFPTVAGAPTYGGSFTVDPSMVNTNHRVHGGDLDGDGDDDILHVKNYGTGDIGPTIQTYENVGGTLVQRPAQAIPTSSSAFSPHNTKLVDWDGDGWMDVVTNSYDLRFLSSNGDWTFTEAPTINGSGGQSAGAGPVDVDGDGNVDYVATRTVVLGEGSFDVGSAVGTGFSLSQFFEGVFPFDRDGDGDVDLNGGGFAAYANDGTGTFTNLGLGNVTPAPPGASYLTPVAFTDLTGDGLRDYVVGLFAGGTFDMRLLADDGTGFYEHQGLAAPSFVQIPAPSFPGGYWFGGDADDDGDPDLLVQDGYWQNQSTGFLNTFVPAYTGIAKAAADLDGDGDNDLVGIRDLGSTAEIVHWEKVGGVFQPIVLGEMGDDEVETVLFDLDADGDLDLWAGHPDLDGVDVWENAGGVFSKSATLDARGINLRDPVLEDVDGDGQLELMMASVISNGYATDHWLVSVYENPPGFGFELVAQYMLISEIEAFVDGDGDGDHDIFGFRTFENLRVVEPAGGAVRQYGTGFPGTDGDVPLLGAFGPITSSNPAKVVRLVQGVGAGLTWFVVGAVEDSVVGVPAPGMTLLVGAYSILPPFVLDGAPGIGGAGATAVGLPSSPGLLGITFYTQAFVADAGSITGLSASNGLEVTFGL